MRTRRTLVVLLSCSATGLPAQDPARQAPTPGPGAQQPPPAATPTAEPTAQAELEAPPRTAPVVVEARKWREPAAAVPQALSVVDGRPLEDAHVDAIRDAGARVPNLFFTEFSAARLSFPTMRGIGSGQGDPAVVTYVGGVPQLTTNTTNLPLCDVERIEFLRGPQGTLFGRNALGGVIRIVERPPAHEPGADLRGTFGNFGLQQYRLSASSPLAGDGLRFRVTGLGSRRDGYTTNDFTGNDVDGRDQLLGRAELEWQPDERWDIALRVEGHRARDGGFVLAELNALRARPHHVAQDFEGNTERDTATFSLAATRYGESTEFTSISALQDWSVLENADFDFSVLDGVRRLTDERQTAFYQELRLGSTRDRELALGADATAKWLVGASGFLADTERTGANDYRPDIARIPSPFPPPPVGLDTMRGEFDDWSLAVFGEVAVTIARRWDLGFGLRYDREDKRADLRRTFAVGGTVVSDVPQRLDATFDQLVPQASLGFHASDEVLLHARIAKGWKAGGFNLAAPADRFTWRPETSLLYEVGAKTTWCGGRLGLDVAAFLIDWDDMQLSQFDVAVGGYVTNAGAATSRGGEAELRAEVARGLVLTGAVGYTDASFDRFTDAYGGDVAGRTLPYAPEATWRLGAEYGGGLGEQGRWFAGADWSGTGTYYLDAANRQSESFDLLGCHAGVERGNFRLSAFLRNALDEEYVTVAFQPNPADPSYFVGENGAPRTFGFELAVRF